MFNSRLDLLTGTNGYYFADEEGKEKLVRTGDPAPGGGTLNLLITSQTSVNNSGQVAFRSPITSNTPSDVGVFRAGPDGLELIARQVQAAPDGSGTFTSVFPGSLDSMNDAGQVAFWAQVTHPILGTHEKIYVGDGTTITQMARQGDAAPGMSGQMSSFGYLSLNNSGQVAFDVYTTANVQGIYVSDGVNHTLIAGAGGAVPGGGEFVGFNEHDLNEAGEVAVYSAFREFPGGPLMFGLFRGDGATMVQIAREGQTAPDQDGTFTWQSFSSFQMNDAGQVAFRGLIDAPVDYRAILLGDGGALTQIAREGMAAPGGNGQFTNFSGVPQLNNQGHVAFSGVVSDSPGGDNETGVYLYDGTSLVQLVRTGQALAGSTVTSANVAMAGINDEMQVAYRANLADGRIILARFEPHLYWSNLGSGDWSDDDNWSLGFAPRQPYDVFIIAENPFTVTGPTLDRTVKSLTLGGENSANATLDLANGVTLTATNGATIRANGIVSGAGTFAGNVTNEGAVSPGSSPGTLHIEGDYTQSSTGKLIIEIASDTDYDKLLVSGNITLGGAISVSFLNGYVPTEGQTFSIFGDEFSAIAGAFESISFPTFDGLTFAVSQALGAFNLQVVQSLGDFNHDGSIDAADYVVWRKSGGATDDYNTWRAHFGQSTGSGSGASGSIDRLHPAVPEPSGMALFAFAIVLFSGLFQRR